MGFYLRKSINLGGGFRLNLSGGGVGVSGGVKGFRLGANRTGTYVHIGRGGAYYRKKISWNNQNPRFESLNATGQAHQSPTGNLENQENNLLPELSVQDVETSNKEISKAFEPRPDRIYSIGLFLLGLLVSIPLFLVGLLLTIAGAVWIGHSYFIEKRPVFVYDLDEKSAKEFSEFYDALCGFFETKKLWIYSNRELTDDYKRNAGAGSIIKRGDATFVSDSKLVEANIPIPVLSGANDKVIFLPDMVMVKSRSKIATFQYPDVSIFSENSRFVEDEAVPADASVVDYTWRFVNKDGGPDRRYNNNQKIPVCAYQSFGIKAGERFARLFSKSAQRNFVHLNAAFSKIQSRELREQNASIDLTLLPSHVGIER